MKQAYSNAESYDAEALKISTILNSDIIDRMKCRNKMPSVPKQEGLGRPISKTGVLVQLYSKDFKRI